jgi:translation initiation factor IF-2
MEAAVEFEKLVSLAKLEATDTMPKSVRTRYEKRLAALRTTLQEQQHAYPLGVILVSIGAITDEQLSRALRAQESSHTQKLLGEFLVEMNFTSREELLHALAIQTSTAQVSYSPIA